MSKGIQIAALFLTILISSLNAGLNKISTDQESLAFYEKSSPISQHPSVFDYYIFLCSDSGLKIRLTSESPDKIATRTKLQAPTKFTEISREKQTRILSFLHGPEFIEIVLSPHRITFPFSYFW